MPHHSAPVEGSTDPNGSTTIIAIAEGRDPVCRFEFSCSWSEMLVLVDDSSGSGDGGSRNKWRVSDGLRE